MKETYLDFLSFLKNPSEQQDQIQNFKEKVKKLFYLLLLDIPLMGILLGVLYFLKELGLFNENNNKLFLLFEKMPIWQLLLGGIILVPFLEELIFRLYLRFKRNYFLQFIIFLFSITGAENKLKIETFIKNNWSRRFGSIFYFSAILFAIMHISNYEYSNLILLFAPIIVAPQFLVGLFCGYLRIRHSLF